jgi:hypothetical protein
LETESVESGSETGRCLLCGGRDETKPSTVQTQKKKNTKVDKGASEQQVVKQECGNNTQEATP